MHSDKQLALRIMALCDLTSLNDDDTEETIAEVCKKAINQFGSVATVCIYPLFVKLAKKLLLGTGVKICCVSNFPSGNNEPQAVYAEIKQALADGADEIDLVMPYKKYLDGDRISAIELIHGSKKICGAKILLKVILETGILKTPENILAASNDAIAAGADFLKTSTGKVTINATLQAAEIMLQAIRTAQEKSGLKIGFKAAGGIRAVEQAKEYLCLASEIMGEKWITPQNFRFGASKLLDDIMLKLQ